MEGHVKKKDLSDIVGKITSGTVISRVECKDERERIGEIRILPLKSITNGVIDDNEVQNIDISKPVKQDKLTRSGDIIVKLNQPYDSARIGMEHAGVMFPSFCCVLRDIDYDQVDQGYLVAYLNSDFVKQYLKAANRASAASLLKIGDIKKLPIVLPPLEQQKLIGEIYEICCKRHVILSKMMKNEMVLVEHMVMDAVREEFKDEK